MNRINEKKYLCSYLVEPDIAEIVIVDEYESADGYNMYTLDQSQTKHLNGHPCTFKTMRKSEMMLYDTMEEAYAWAYGRTLAKLQQAQYDLSNAAKDIKKFGDIWHKLMLEHA